MDEGTLEAELAEWNERNRRSREEYYSHPGPFYWIPVGLQEVKPPGQGNPPSTVREALDRALADLYQARTSLSRSDRLVLELKRQLIALEIRLGDRNPDGSTHTLRAV